MRTISERLDSFAAWWEHEKGDKLFGVVTDVDTRHSEYGEYRIVTVLVEEPGSTEKGGEPIAVGEERGFHASSTVAKNEVEKKDPQPGDSFGVAFHGVPEGKDFKLYKIIVEKTVTGEPANELEPAAEPVASAEPDDDLPF
jgi:hypothetical protein